MPGTSSIDGLASGLNTTQIIDSLMKLQQAPVDQLTQEQTDKTNIVSAFQALQAKMLALSTMAGSLAQPATWSKYAVQVSDSTVLTASAGSSASAGTYDVQVLSVAKNNTLASQGISDQALALFGGGTITISVGTGSAQTITIDSSNNSLTGIARAINAANAGVTASIINDGSQTSPYRLILSANKTGQANKISVTSNLSGSQGLNFSTAVFDAPETLNRATSTTSAITLGGTASYSGNANKTYTFTVAGTGSKTVGSDNITLNWTDGTNSGSILVTQADSEVTLVGTGADGLKLNFSSGVLSGGDKFQIQTFAPVLQEASDASIAVGSVGGSGSPITITSPTNSFQNVIGGLNINVLKPSDAGTSVNIQTGVDTQTIKSKITDFINAYNDVNKYINDQNTYNADTKQSGVLFGDMTLDAMQTSLRGVISNLVPGVTGQYNQLFAIGVRTGADGSLSIADSASLDDALQNHLTDVVNMFTASAKASTDSIQFISAGSKAVVGQPLQVNVTRAATQGTFLGGGIADPSITPLTLTTANNHLQISVDGMNSGELILTPGTYNSTDDLVKEIQSKIDADPQIGSRGLIVSWHSFGNGNGRLEFQSSTFGSQSRVSMVTSITNSAFAVLGLASGSAQQGVDVAGTINGEPADGAGQILTARDANNTTSGVKIKITMSQAQVGSGTTASITLSKGAAARMGDLLDSFTASGVGLIDSLVKSYQDQITDIQSQINDLNARLATKREDLFNEFNAMETALSQLTAQSQYLTGQLAGMNANWNFNSGSTRSSSIGTFGNG